MAGRPPREIITTHVWRIGYKWSISGGMSGKVPRRRWQVELRPGDEQAIEFAHMTLGVENESQTGRELLAVWKRVVDAIRDGQVISLHRADDPLALDAFPELTRALRPDSAYDFLVRVADPWRRQLYIKGRRQTAAQLVADMRANDWDISLFSSGGSPLTAGDATLSSPAPASDWAAGTC